MLYESWVGSPELLLTTAWCGQYYGLTNTVNRARQTRQTQALHLLTDAQRLEFVCRCFDDGSRTTAGEGQSPGRSDCAAGVLEELRHSDVLVQGPRICI